jgi:L-aspartate oxidase
MGGIDTDATGHASLGNLWVCGEASSTGLHGANRLASNGLLEALVFARICALGIDAQLGAPADAPEIEFDFPEGAEGIDESAVAQLRAAMTDGVGVVRNAEGLKRALRTIARIEAAHPAQAMLNMTATATLIAAAALAREESRGGHFRSDFPKSDPAMAQRTHMTLADALAIRARVLEEQ